MRLFVHELRLNRKSMLIWALCIGFVCFGCLLLYNSLEDSLSQMSDMYSKMGSFSTAFGMDKVGIATIEGYYATEIAIMFGLGAAMYAGLIGTGMLSKEEEGHTAEFLNTLPVSRTQVVASKYAAMVVLIVALNIICVLFSWAGFLIMGKGISWSQFFLYHGAALFMQLELGSVCFLLSSISRKKQIGLGLGLVILFYTGDIMCRIVPALKNLKYVTPFYYANGADIFSSGKVEGGILLVGAGILLVSAMGAFVVYNRKDLT